MQRRLLISAAAALAAIPAAAFAHHGWSEYDASTPLTLTGKVLEAGYEHPHGFVRLETADKVWLVILAPPSRMERRGLSREQLVAGVEATVAGYPKRSDPDELRAERVTIAGNTVELR